MDEQTLDQVARRVEILEKQNRHLRRIFVSIAVAASLLLLVAETPSKEEVVAREFVLVDSRGTARARLFMDHGGPSLSLYDPAGIQRATLTQTHDAAGLILYNDPPERYGGAELLLMPDGPTLLLNSAKHKSLAALSASARGPALDISDGEGYKATVGVSDTYVPRTGENHRTSAAAITLIGKDGKVIWAAP